MFQHARRPSPAMVIAVIALVAALTGGAYAAGVAKKNSVATKSIKNNAITGAKLRNGAVDGDKVADGSLTGADLGASTIGAAQLQSDAQPSKVLTGTLAPSQESAHMTIGNWTVFLISNYKSSDCSVELRSGTKPGYAGLNGTPIKPVPAGDRFGFSPADEAARAFSAVTEDGTSGLTGLTTIKVTAPDTCVFTVSLNGN